jgi:adenylylsulfate kinase-like enzyme
MVVWLTGLSGAGKTTVAERLIEIVKPILPSLVLIDGDAIRELFGANLGFDEGSRKVQIGRIQRIALFLNRQNIPIIVSALYATPELLEWNRKNLSGYFEIYVDTPLAVVQARDTKGFYAKALAGEQVHVVGMDIPWQAPKSPDITVYTDTSTIDSIAYEIINSVPKLQELYGANHKTSSLK